MFQRILIPTDFSASAGAALDLARRHFPDAERCLLHVLDPQRLAASLASSVSVRDDRDALAGSLLDRLRSLAIAGETCVVEIGAAVETILSKSRSWSPDLIVMGTHGRTGVALFLDGSVAERVVRHARCPVLIEHEQDGAG